MQPLVGEHKDVRFANTLPAKDLVTVTLAGLKHITTIERAEGAMPTATVDKELTFYGFADLVQENTSSAPSSMEKQELSVWQLCSVLFDDPLVICRVYKMDMPGDLRKKYEPRLRLDAFKAFWAKLVAPSVDAGLRRAKTAEEKALLLLTKNDVAGACDALVAAKDFRLATLVAQLPGSRTTRDVMKRQIEAWRKRKDWSEMSDAVRALYCILAGELCVVHGQMGAAEDKAAEFCISEHFGLSWQQSLALRVCFGGHDVLKEAIGAYCKDLEDEQREPHPTPFWVQDMNNANFEDEDTLMGLLRLFAGGVDTSELFEPLLVSGSTINSRLAWQLAKTLSAKKLAALPEEAMAKLTLDFATELEAADEIVESAWVLLHLQDSVARQQAVTGLLQRNADKITDPAADGEAANFRPVVNDLQIPRSMVFAAKAIYAKAMDDPYAQTRWLLRAAHNTEAHDVLCTAVGPQAIIEQDHKSLSDLVFEFPRRKPAGWEQGGQVYEDFVRLVSMQSAQRNGDQGEKVLRTLKRGLAGMEDGEGGKTLEQRVAIIEMKRYAEEVTRELRDGEEQGAADVGMMEASSYGFGAGMLENYRRALVA